MKFLLERKYLGEKYTIGRLSIDERYICEVLEDTVRDYNKDGDFDDTGEYKVLKETAIPYGTFEVILSMSPKFKRVLPLLLDVPRFVGIRIHKGVDANSTWGCLIPGENKIKGKVINSEKYEMLIIELMLYAIKNGEEIWISIV